MAASLAPPNRRASAVGLVMSGLTSATLVGVPLAAWLGQHLGWRAAFVLVGGIAALACVLIRRGVPDVPAAHGATSACVPIRPDRSATSWFSRVSVNVCSTPKSRLSTTLSPATGGRRTPLPTNSPPRFT